MQDGKKPEFFDLHTLALTVTLVVVSGLFYATSGTERVPMLRPLAEFPSEVPGWQMALEIPIEPEVRQVLRADETLNRVYADRTGKQANLFVAYFKSQRAGQIPHSPRNCLPGAGWEPIGSSTISFAIPGEPQPISVNRYIVAKGNETSAVLYWYQSRNRILASDFAAKFWLVADSIRYRRSDTALVRVVVPVLQPGVDAAVSTGVTFIQGFLPILRQYLPA